MSHMSLIAARFALVCTGAAACILIASTPSYAEANMTLRVGATTVAPDVTNSSELQNNLGGAKIDADNNTQLGFSFAYRLSPSLSVELLAATPFNHHMKLEGVGGIAKTKHLPPTLSLVADLPTGNAPFHAYAGAGINYTTFFDEQTSGLVGNQTLKLSDSWGAAFLAGVDVLLSSSVGVNASARWIDLNTDVKLGGVNLGEIEIDPWVYTLGLAYQF